MCKADCRYYSSRTQSCDYAFITGHARGCPAEHCTKYERGNRKQASPQLFTGSALPMPDACDIEVFESPPLKVTCEVDGIWERIEIPLHTEEENAERENVPAVGGK